VWAHALEVPPPCRVLRHGAETGGGDRRHPVTSSPPVRAKDAVVAAGEYERGWLRRTERAEVLLEGVGSDARQGHRRDGRPSSRQGRPSPTRAASRHAPRRRSRRREPRVRGVQRRDAVAHRRTRHLGRYVRPGTKACRRAPSSTGRFSPVCRRVRQDAAHEASVLLEHLQVTRAARHARCVAHDNPASCPGSSNEPRRTVRW
jgi:hypothetical protein